MDSLKLMEAEDAMTAFIENIHIMMAQVGYDQQAIENFTPLLMIAKTTTVAQISVQEQLKAMLAKLQAQQDGDA